MKNYFLFLLFISLGSAAQEVSRVHFETGLSWQEVVAKARSEKKDIFVDVYATWCGPCKLMETETFSNDTLARNINDKFVAVRLQMDSTANDKEPTRKWYATAHDFGLKYKMKGYPTFLFFDDNGNLVYRHIGFKDVREFSSLITLALDPQNLSYASSLFQYKNGKKDYANMAGLSLYVRLVLQDKVQADTLAKDVIKNYLDTLSVDRLGEGRIPDFIKTYSGLFGPGDAVFEIAVSRPEMIDSICRFKGFANGITGFYIKTLMTKAVFDGSKPRDLIPNWDEFMRNFSLMYPNSDARKCVLEYELWYYRSLQRWEEWGDVKNVYTGLYPPMAANLGVYTTLNVYGAWDAFLHCNDDKVLREGLKWIDQALAYNEPVGTQCQYRDTKAALLYKLGAVDSAIRVETVASSDYGKMAAQEKGGDTNTQRNDYAVIVDKMQKRLPIYQEEGAIWTDVELTRISAYKK